MGLTSRSLQVLTIVMAIVATIAPLVWWNRMRGPRPIRWAGRMGLLLVGYALTTVAVLVSVNIAYGGLIVSWGDLLANPHAARHFARHGGGNWQHHVPRVPGTPVPCAPAAPGTSTPPCPTSCPQPRIGATPQPCP
jgi:hypothetical protein